MADEQQTTLKKKIQILFQLEKWLDVVKLCESYGEKYGKDMEIDLIRYKTERRLGITAPEPEKPAPERAKAENIEREQPLVFEAMDSVDSDSQALPVAPPADKQNRDDLNIFRTAADEMPAAREEKIAYDPSALDDELYITDPFAENEPGFSLAPDEPLVVLNETSEAEEASGAPEPALEMEEVVESVVETPKEEADLDFSKIAGMTIDADPQLSADKSFSEDVEPVFKIREESPLEDPSRSAFGSFDVVATPAREIPAPPAEAESEEKPPHHGAPSWELLEKKSTAMKKKFNPKRLLLVILPLLAAVVLWLALSGKLNFSKAEAPASASPPSAKPPVARRAQPVKKIPPPEETPQIDLQEKAFAEKFQQAEELQQKGDLLKAWAVVLEAKKIKMTEPLRLLEEQLAQKIRSAEAQAKQQTEVVQSQWQQESQAYSQAEAENTMAAWKNFLKTFPQGEFAFRAERKLALLEKKANENAEQQLLLKIQQAQKVRLRSSYLSLGQADIAVMLRQGGKPTAQFETHEHGGSQVILDYTSGLMWTLWNKPMAYDKAKWWSNRVAAGYGGWRLPTAEEALFLMQMERRLYSGLGGFAVWTGDTVSDQPRTVWVLKLPEGQFSAEANSQVFYVWAVRKAGK